MSGGIGMLDISDALGNKMGLNDYPEYGLAYK